MNQPRVELSPFRAVSSLFLKSVSLTLTLWLSLSCLEIAHSNETDGKENEPLNQRKLQALAPQQSKATWKKTTPSKTAPASPQAEARSMLNAIGIAQHRLKTPPSEVPCDSDFVLVEKTSCKSELQQFCDTLKKEEIEKELFSEIENFMKSKQYPIKNLFGVTLSQYFKPKSKLPFGKTPHPPEISKADIADFLDNVDRYSLTNQQALAKKYEVAAFLSKNSETYTPWGTLKQKGILESQDTSAPKMEIPEGLKGFREEMAKAARDGMYVPKMEMDDKSRFFAIIESFKTIPDIDILKHQMKDTLAGGMGLDRAPLNTYLDLVSDELKPDQEKRKIRFPQLYSEKKHGKLKQIGDTLSFITSALNFRNILVDRCLGAKDNASTPFTENEKIQLSAQIATYSGTLDYLSKDLQKSRSGILNKKSTDKVRKKIEARQTLISETAKTCEIDLPPL